MQSDLPDGTQTEKVGDALLGEADSVILAEPLVPLLSQTQMAYLTVVCGSTELTLFRVWIFRHKVPGLGVGLVVGVGVPVGVGDVDGDVDGVAVGVVSVPPGLGGFELVLCAGAGCGSAVLGAADEPGLGCGSAGALGLGLGWVLGSGVVCAEATCTAAARSTGMPAGCWTRLLTWLAVRVLGIIRAALALGAGLLAAEDEQGSVVAWRVP